MDYDCRTIRNFNTVAAGLTVLQLLGMNQYRKAIILSPLAGQSGSVQAVAAVPFAAGASQQWTVPAGVTQVVDAYVWGSGGNSDTGQAATGGGGGGGGGFATTGPLTVIPGSVFAVAVDAGGGASFSSITDPSAVLKAKANSGAVGALAVGGAGGTATTGIVTKTGGAGGTASGTKGGGGGGGAGNNAVGGAGGAAGSQGAGGGAATILTYGAGGNGGLGGTAVSGAGGNGVSPGGGGGGGGTTAGAAGAGASGLAVIFYVPPITGSGLSIDQDPALILGQGSLNYLFGTTYPTIITREQIGDSIRDPWYVISGLASQTVRVTEYSYVPDE